jgi:23S rRNA (cytosine1962-C5)-methyltransferase/23S rRNA (guanine2445-N2)-methyltransferase / 23S rRNA (guanine2069-N7)-methyltransferase
MNPIKDRLIKNFKKLSPLAAKYQLDAYRLYDRDIPEYPFAIDLYREKALIHDRREAVDFTPERENHFLQLTQALNELSTVTKIHIKTRAPQRIGSDRSRQYTKLDEKNNFEIVRETQAHFYVNLSDYLDTGLFLDHRRVRQLIFDEAKHKRRFLNLFSYTASASVFAALAGAKTVNVDLSNTYTDWAQENFKLNQIDLRSHEFLCMNAFDRFYQYKETFGLHRKLCQAEPRLLREF